MITLPNLSQTYESLGYNHQPSNVELLLNALLDEFFIQGISFSKLLLTKKDFEVFKSQLDEYLSIEKIENGIRITGDGGCIDILGI